MKNFRLGKSDLTVPAIAVGCMRITSLSDSEANRFINHCLELGANFFDHADIYGKGESERIFSRSMQMNPSIREKMIIQTKCGIHDGTYDFSKEHILSAVDGSLKRLNTDYIDVLLLHRPDALMDPEEVADALDVLHSSGKVRNFGVSNFNPMQIRLLKKYLKHDIVANQLQLSITHSNMIKAGLNVNTEFESAIDKDGSILDFCRLEDITVQPWSPFQHGFFEGVFLDNDKFPELNAKIDEIAAKYNVSNTTIAIAWLLRHPAKMQPVTGTMNITRITDCAKATGVELTRKEWYEILLTEGNKLP